jgi:hypothetical protein
MRGWRAERRRLMVSAIPCGSAAGAFRRPHALKQRSGSACHLRTSLRRRVALFVRRIAGPSVSS